MTDYAEGERLKRIWASRRDVWFSDWFREQRTWIIGTTIAAYVIVCTTNAAGDGLTAPWWELGIFIAAISYALTWTMLYPVSILIGRSNRKWLRAQGEDPDLDFQEFLDSLPEDVKNDPPRMDRD